MMASMNTQQRIADICKRSGLSENIVRSVIKAETESIAESLKRGERATLIGRVSIKPEIRKKLLASDTVGEFKEYIKLNATVAASLEAMLEGLSGFSESQIENIEGIRLTQIQALT